MATVSDLKLLVSGLEFESTERLQALLDIAGQQAQIDGVKQTEPEYDLLQQYYAAHLLAVQGGTGAVTSESVDGVSRSYATANDGKRTSWKVLYDDLLGRLRGFRARFA
jgi:hypothetical protein